MRVLIAAGSSGGHIFPAIAAAFKFKELDASGEVFFVGSAKKLDNEIFGREGVKYAPLSYSKKQLFKDMISSFLILRKFKPDVAVGFGGYCSFPVLAMAKMMGLPTMVHEQNYVPGLANRVLSGFVDRVAVSFKETNGFLLRKGNISQIGNPIRINLVKLDKQKAREGLGLARDKFTILVMGGSQGARFINETVLRMLKGIDSVARNNMQVIHLSGMNEFESVKAVYEPLGISHRVFSFFDKMSIVYSAADIVVSRAGATSLAEITFFGLPSILIPYPTKKVHQAENAGVLGAGGAAVVASQGGLTPSGLWNMISGLMHCPDKLKQMSENAQKLARPNAAGDIAEEIARLYKNKTRTA
ncbi:MAG: undecaprenyldiphospho-muramoylpentapeptide beta-N-acetylglucosaminyltransferase [Candidatus Omnitrophica bacterium]|nr:undecaprenyldiphospho-muramoylpentapeptide beta-N-acetylglucosaminyltransferase [Candidatus Omnitrophota bacterium]